VRDERIGGLERILGLRDRYRLDVSGDAERRIDRRVVLALAVGMDALRPASGLALGSVSEQRPRQLGDRLARLAEGQPVFAAEPQERLEAGERVQRRHRPSFAQPRAQLARPRQPPH
jgi:hypothetical protein